MSEYLNEREAAAAAAGATPQRAAPGAILRAAREQRGLSISNVSDVIRFSPRQIEALERDDYASLPGMTVVRGFVRGYAKFLQLDAAPLLAGLEPAVQPEGVSPPPNMGYADAPPLLERVSLRKLAIGLLVVVVALLGAMLISKTSRDNIVEGAGMQASEGDAPQPPATAPAPVADSGATPSPAPAVSSAAKPLVEAAPVVAGGEDLLLEFDDQSWIEVRDASQKIIYSGVFAKGTRKAISGQGPFHLWVGKASAVRVARSGRSIDLRPATREDVARLSIE